MTKIGFIFFFLLIISIDGFAQLNLPEPSPHSFTKQRVGFADITIDYSRPGVKGRKIFGELVPFGKIWRTGASDATKVGFNEDLTVEGKKIPKGKYSLFTIPGEDTWEIIFNKDTTLHGTGEYADSLDVLRVKVKPEKTPRFYETFTIEITDIIKNNASLNIIWENTLVKIKVETSADEKIMSEINNRINVQKEDKAGLFFQSAQYYFDNNKDLTTALNWINKAIAKEEDFAYYHLKAKILGKQNNFKDAITAAERSTILAKEKKMNSYVALNQKLIEEWKTNK